MLDEGNTLLGDDYLEKLTVLRINRKFMEHMRANHKLAAKQAYDRTLVDVEKAKLLEEEDDEF